MIGYSICGLTYYFIKYNKPVPNNMLPSPARRMVLSSMLARVATMDFQRAGYRNGIMPSITNTRHRATPRSCHMLIRPDWQTQQGYQRP
ncbi:MAG: hypothetical protein ACI81O_001953, partial [Cyclobacteriaceae bacterium]